MNEENKSFIHQDCGRAEKFWGIFWLSLGSLISVFLEVFYLGSSITLPGGKTLPFPITIIIAFLFNMVLTRTAMLWEREGLVSVIPLLSWLLGYFFLGFVTVGTDNQIMVPSVWSVLLLFVGFCGGIWPKLKGAA